MKEQYLSRIQFSPAITRDGDRELFQYGSIGYYNFHYGPKTKEVSVFLVGRYGLIRDKVRTGIGNIDEAREAVFEMICEMQSMIIPFPEVM